MIKYIIRISLLLITLIIIFICVNLFDSKEVKNGFSEKDLMPASVEIDNGFYIIMAFCYPLEFDITASKVIKKIKKLADPDLITDNDIKEYNKYIYESKFSQNLKVGGPKNPEDDWVEYYLSEKDNIKELKKDYSVLLARYERLINAEKIEDFSLPRVYFPIPHLFLLMKASRLFIAINILYAMNGEWEKGVKQILQNTIFCKKLIKSSRYLATNFIGKKMMHMSLQALASIMNQKECPKEIYLQILNGLPPLEYSEFGTKNHFIYLYLTWVNIIESDKISFGYTGVIKAGILDIFRSIYLKLFLENKLFLQKNRTKQYLFNEQKKSIEVERQPPYQWPDDPDRYICSYKKGMFWWLQNPVGKILYEMATTLKTSGILYRSYQLKARYDLTRLSAEAHLKYASNRILSEMLQSLDTYQIHDPFSGKPYLFNEQKQVLYSVGINKVDDGGTEKGFDLSKYDIILPCKIQSKIMSYLKR